MNLFSVSRRAFLGGLGAGAAHLALRSDALAIVLPDEPLAGTVLGLRDHWNDAPAIAAGESGSLIVAWVAYRDHDEEIYVARWDRASPCALEQLSGVAGRDFGPAVAAAPGRGFWVVWTGEREGQWRILGRQFADGRWRPEVRISAGDEACWHAALAADARDPYVAWERLTRSGPEIWSSRATPEGWEEGRRVAAGSNPSLAVDPGGRPWMAWQVAEGSRYEVHASRLDGGLWSWPERVAFGRAHYRRPSLAVSPGGTVWVTCEGLVPTRSTADAERQYRFDDMCYLLPLSACTYWRGGSGWQPAPVDPSERQAYLPRVVCDERRTWLIYYQREQEKFRALATALEGDGWRATHDFSVAAGFGRKLPLAGILRDGALWVAVQSDDRARVDDPVWTIPDAPSRITLCSVRTLPDPPATTPPPNARSPVFDNPDHGPARQYATTVGGERLTLCFGDLHKHSEISRCGRFDGHIEETYAYARDIRRLDFMQSTDHAEHQNGHDWYVTRKYASLFDCPGAFVAFAGYEWTSEFNRGDNLREGHYNPTFLTHGDNLPCVSASSKDGNTPPKLWRRLRESLRPGDDVITIAHHPGRREAPLDWRYYDPDISPLIEIAQARGSYEYHGCPDAEPRYNDTARLRGHLVQDGLARGYELGFVGGGDHSGRCLAAVFAPALTRRAIFDALRRRRCYATNGPKIVLDIRLDGHFMGERFESAATRHTLVVTALGRSIQQVDVWKDGRVVHREEGRARDAVQFTYLDASRPDRRESYYYVRVIQDGMGMAWSSPIWVRHTHVEPRVCLYVDDKVVETVQAAIIVRLPILVRNELARAATAQIEIEVPADWQSDWRLRRIEVPAEWWAEVHVELQAPPPPYEGARAIRITMTSEAGQAASEVRFAVGPRAGDARPAA